MSIQTCHPVLEIITPYDVTFTVPLFQLDEQEEDGRDSILLNDYGEENT